MDHGEATVVVDDQPAAKPYPIPAEDVNTWAEALAQKEEMLRFLREERGLSQEVIDTFQLGWDGERVTIPILDQEGNCVNVRRYLPCHNGDNKVISYAKGTGEARLFPLIELYKDDPLIIVEGELDALKLLSEGFHAVTATAGAGSWRDEWAPLFRDKRVVICYDNDKAGRDGARKVADSLRGQAKSVHIVDWAGQGMEDGEDVTDFFVKYGRGRKQFERLLRPKTIVITVEELLAEDQPTRPCLIGNQILPDGGCCFLGGLPKVGKSLLAVQMGVELALGRAFLDEYAVPGPLKVVYLQGEMSKDQMRARLRQMCGGLTPAELAQLNVNFLPTVARSVSLDDPEQRGRLIDDLEQYEGLRVLVVDPLIMFHGQNENDASEMKRVLDGFDWLKDRLGVALVVVHHYGHGGQQDQGNRSRLRGSSVLAGYLDTSLGLEGKGDKISLNFELMRNGPTPESVPLHRDPESLLYSVAEGGVKKKVGNRDVRKLVALSNGSRAQKKDVVSQIVQGFKVSERTAEGAIKSAIEAGAIRPHKGEGRGGPVWYSLN
jgi:5S rRNA maturation endonuclease (ribonuclease M5)